MKMPGDPSFGRRGRRSGFNSIPHEFWELRFGDNDRTSMSALILLGWLHSHQAEYLARLSQRMICDRLGWSRPRIAAALEILAADGWVVLTTVANRSCILVDEDRFADWLEEAIAARRNGNDSIPSRQTDGNDSIPSMAMKQGQQLALDGNDSIPSTIENTISKKTKREPPGDGTFDAFWQAYPNKQTKPDALKAWNRATKQRNISPVTIDAGLRRWTAYWDARNDPSVIPYPASWLNGDRFNDTPPPITKRDRRGPALDTDRGGPDGKVDNW